MQTVNRLAQRFLAFGAGLSMALVFAIIFVNSLRRYTTGESFRWGEELPIYLAIYGVMFGIGLAYLQDSHIRFTLVTDFLSVRVRRLLFAGLDLVMIVIGIVLAWSGLLFATRRGAVDASGIISTAKQLAATTGQEWLVWVGKVGTWQFAIGIGGLIIAIAALLRFLSRIRED